MSQFLGGGGVECGPTSALKDVGSRVERDYGLQRDRYGAQPQAGPSAGPSAFRTRPGAAPAPQQEPQGAFDLSQLRSHLPPGAGPMHAGPAGPAAMAPMQAPARWADTYDGKGKARASPGTVGAAGAAWGSEFEQRASPQAHAPAHHATHTASPAMAPWQRAGPTFAPPPPHFAAMSSGPMYAHAPPVWAPPPQAPVLAHPAPVKAVPAPPPHALAQQQQPQHVEPQGEQTHIDPDARPQDELARTAQALVDQLDREELASNQKLADSQFVRLLRGLGDGSVVVQEGSGVTKEGTDVADGAHFVDAQGGGDWASAFLGSDAAPQGVRDAAGVRDTAADIQASLRMADGTARMRRKSVHFDDAETASGVPRNLEEAMRHATAVPGVGAAWEEDQDLDDEFDTDMLLQFNGVPRVAEQAGPSVAQHEAWDHMNDQMNQIAPEWYATDTTPQPYLFHRANPYALGAPIERELSPTTMGVLELEAAVQQDPRDASAWLALGLKQQENEREDAAIRALARAVQLAPETRGAWLALAVSYTNEGKDGQAHDALEHWLDLAQPGGGGTTAPSHGSETMYEDGVERQARIISRLIDIARMSPDDLDVDVQVALGVLFNASEDYQKAEDCFVAALEARPDDWVLYNRLGATLANSGRSHEAIKYYHRALGLHPNFVRAQFNLGISYINLAQYRLAAQCILDAIRLQHSDVTEGYGADSAGEYTKGVTSDALWTTLRMACHHLQRPDLVSLATAKDLSGFPLEL